MSRPQVAPLRTLNIQPRPITSHCLAWSQDGELAVATDDGIHVYLPEYPPPPNANTSNVAGRRDDVGNLFVAKDQFSISQQISSRIRPIGTINNQLFAFKGVRPPYSNDVVEGEETYGGSSSVFHGVGKSNIVGRGAAMFQVVRVEWSPAGVGVNLRPVVTAMLTSGHLITFGEIADQETLSFSGMRNRSFKGWRILWGLGGSIPLPDAEGEGYQLMDERTTSFSWARAISSGRGLLAYMNDDEDIVIMSVQYYKKSKEEDTREGWDIEEVARFRASSPHIARDDATDPDFVPFKSAFALKWSPWLEEGSERTATLAYMTNNYVGFRRVTIDADWEKRASPGLEVEATDTIGICACLQSDAFLEWEDAVWTEEGKSTARGILTTPFDVKPFEIPLNGPVLPPTPEHSSEECSTLYPATKCSNPITGLVVHPPTTAKPPLPLYTLTRLSATHSDVSWYETNLESLPDATNGVPGQPFDNPTWVSRIQRAVSKCIPRSNLFGAPDSDLEDSESEDLPDDDEPTNAEGNVSSAQPVMIHPWRYRIWGLASSPGGARNAVVVSKYSTYYPTRKGACSIYFDSGAAASSFTPSNVQALTTEGKMWEWMYHGGPSPYAPAPTAPIHPDGPIKSEGDASSALQAFFYGVLEQQQCEFCDSKLSAVGEAAWCENGHSWARCSATGLAIMKPGTSNVCAVCAARCLKSSELDILARMYAGEETKVPDVAGGCGRCGGKFV